MVTQKIRVTVEKVLVERSNGYVVVRVRTLTGEALRAVGVFVAAALGAEYELLGRFEYHPTYGRQFKVDSLTMALPTNVVGIERFLASGRFKGIGPKTAHRIVSHFGVQTLEILQNRPQDVQDVPGIAKGKAAQIAASFSAQQDLARLGSFLRGHDLPAHLAEKLADAYGGGSAALRILQENPYQTVEDVRGIGFKTADDMARAVGISARAPERIAAALLHALATAQDEGHMYLPLPVWTERASQLLALPGHEVAVIAARIAARGSVVFEEPADGQIAVYATTMHRTEVNIATRLRELICHDIAGSWFVESIKAEADGECVLTAKQLAAATAVGTYPLVVLTGGPGTGKTTTVRRTVQESLARNLRVVLSAPTGRAAKRLAESTGRIALTLHRLLEVGRQPGGGFGFGRGKDRRLEGDVFIVDEASMIDAPLFSHFLDALPNGARLLLVGDPEQLPAVGPGSVLHDVIASGIAHVYELDVVFRQERQSGIIFGAHAVRKGELPPLTRDQASDFFFLAEEDPEAALKLVVELAAERLPHYLGLDSKTGVQVLSPMKKGVCGVDRLNDRLSAHFCQHAAAEMRVGGRVFRLQDKVMNTKNDYDRDIYNGDMGFVHWIGADEMVVHFGLDDDVRDIRFARGDCSALVHAYAISVHKSQGSEYPCVILPVLREHAVMLHRRLLYTAMTRARRLLVLVGSRKALQWAVRRVEGDVRYTGLASRLMASTGSHKAEGEG